MIDDILYIEEIKGRVLDQFLAMGWYRMGKYIFTTNYLDMQQTEAPYRVLWLRYAVPRISLSAKNNKLLTANSRFSISCRPFSVTDELRQLHQAYGGCVSFQTAATIEELLVDVDNEVYNTQVIEVRDSGRLVMAGILDRGADTIAGIVNIYHPDYKKYSPGKYLMLLKYQYCIDNNTAFYYPGYYSPDCPVFDYKLFIDKNATEVFLPQYQMWFPYPTFQAAGG